MAAIAASAVQSQTKRRTAAAPRLTRERSRGARGREADGTDERFRARVRVVGVDRERDRARIGGLLAVDRPVVRADVATLLDPAPQLGGGRAQDDVGNGARLLAAERAAGRRGGGP